MINKRIVLASASPRRKELMAMAGYEFEVQVSHKEEVYSATEPSEIVKELSLLKAQDIASMNEKKSLIVIGADTVVAHNGKILGKPQSEQDAFDMIKGYQGDKHQVYTGVAILDYDEDGNERVVNHAVRTDVYVNAMTDEEVWNYIHNDNVMDKAGAYAVQGIGARYIRGINGDFYTVMGLPCGRLHRFLFDKIRQKGTCEE